MKMRTPASVSATHASPLSPADPGKIENIPPATTSRSRVALHDRRFPQDPMTNTLARQLREHASAIMQRWEARVRAEVLSSTGLEKAVLRDHLPKMMEVMTKVLAGETDPRTAVRDAAFMTIHGRERANQLPYLLEEMILECQILQEVVLDELETEHTINQRDRTIILQYFGEMIRVAAGEFARTQLEHLKELDQAKDEFLAMLGHELRNPLGAISSSLLLLRVCYSSGTPPPEQALEVAERQVGNMKRLTDELLDVARITQGKIVVHKQRVDLAALVNRAIDATRAQLESRDHRITVSQSPATISVEADSVRLEQCFVNLLTNASKYTPNGGHIDVVVGREEGEAVVRVGDNGTGMDADLLPHVFDLFRQGHRSLDRAEGGLGIGLTVAKRLIELQGGRIEAKSEGLGKGSEFIVRLPVMNVPLASSASSEQESPSMRIKVLIVEDNEDSATMLGLLLQGLGHDVVIANEGTAALELAKHHHPDVALLDIGLPGMNGYELATKLRNSGCCPSSMRVVAVTGYAKDDVTLSAAGFHGFLGKPVGLTELKTVLGSVRSSRP